MLQVSLNGLLLAANLKPAHYAILLHPWSKLPVELNANRSVWVVKFLYVCKSTNLKKYFRWKKQNNWNKIWSKMFGYHISLSLSQGSCSYRSTAYHYQCVIVGQHKTFLNCINVKWPMVVECTYLVGLMYLSKLRQWKVLLVSGLLHKLSNVWFRQMK